MSSELGDPTVFADGADAASAVTHDGETVCEAAAQSSVARSFVDSRIGREDRRKPSLKSFIYGAFYPRRRRIRRAEDRDHTFLDYHPAHLLLVCTVILALSVVDGLLTVYLINNGMREINPLMAFLVSTDPVLFALGKIACTTVGVVGLVLTAHMRIYRIVKASTVLYFFLLIYFVLMLYEVGLIWIIN